MANGENYGLDILFIVSPTNARSEYMPFYFLYLAGYLEKHGFRTDIVDPHEKEINANYDIIIREVIFSFLHLPLDFLVLNRRLNVRYSTILGSSHLCASEKICVLFPLGFLIVLFTCFCYAWTI